MASQIISSRQLPLDQNPAAAYLLSLSAGSRRTMEQALNTIAKMLGYENALACPWESLRFQHTNVIRTKLAEQYTYTTANKMLSALKGVLKNAWKLGLMSAEDYRRAVDFKPVKGDKPDAASGRSLSMGEISALFSVCINDDSPNGARDCAILAVSYACGLRRSEIVSLNIEDFANDTLTVRGKRNKVRTIPLDNGALDAVNDWLAVRGTEEGPLFVRILKGGHITNERLTDQAIYYIQSQRAEQANVKKFSPHDMRRTFISDLLDAGIDISTVQKLAGHSNVNTTAGYDRRGERAKRNAVKALHIPYKKPDR